MKQKGFVRVHPGVYSSVQISNLSNLSLTDQSFLVALLLESITSEIMSLSQQISQTSGKTNEKNVRVCTVETQNSIDNVDCRT